MLSSPLLPLGIVSAKVSIASSGALDPAGTRHARQYLTKDGEMGDPSDFSPRMVLVTCSTMAPPRGDAWANCHSRSQFARPGPPAVVVYRSHCPSMSTPVTAIVDGLRLPAAETLPLSAEKEAV